MRHIARFALLLLASGAAAQPLSLEFAPLGRSEGLTGNSITSVEIDADGFAWLGTDGAADRYDGARVSGFPIGGNDQRGFVNALEVDTRGMLWAGSSDGLWRYDSNRSSFAEVVFKGLERINIRELQADRASGLWIGTAASGVIHMAGGRARHFSVSGGHLKSDSVRAIQQLTSGDVAVATASGMTWFDTKTSRVLHNLEIRDVTALADVDGLLWVGRADGSVLCLDTPSVVCHRVVGLGAAVTSIAPSSAHPGWIWVGYRGGGIRLIESRTGTIQGLPPAAGLPDAFDRAEVLSLHEVGGVLWVGTVSGAYFADVSPARLYAIQGGAGAPLAVPGVFGIHISHRDPKRVWVGTIQGGLHRVERQASRVTRWFGEPGHPLRVIFSILEGEDGAVWLGANGASLWRFLPDVGRATEIPLVPNRSGVVNDIQRSQYYPGQFWVSTSDAGLVRFDPSKKEAVQRYETAGIVPVREVWQTLEIGDALWIATGESGLWRLELGRGHAERVRSEECEIDPTLLSLAGAPDGSLWTGSEQPRLFRIDPDAFGCQEYTPDDGLPSDAIGGLFPDARGHIWMSTNLGLFRFDPKAVVFTPFTPADGLATSELYWYARDQSASGEIAVGGNGGLTVFDPMGIDVDSMAQPVVLSGLRVDGEDRPVPKGEIVLGHTESDVALDLATLDFRRPETTRYRVRLSPADPWEASPPEARYRALAPGRYTFQAAATNRDGFWSEPLTVPIRIRPPFWQAVPFWLLVFAMGGAVGYAAHRYRVAQIQRVERTRRRIADDLHDDIGSKISSVALRLDMARMRGSLPEAERQRLGTLAATARSVVGDLRDTVWLVDAGHDDLASVLSRMEQFAGATLDGRGTVTAPEAVDAVPLAMEPRRDLYLLFTEALHNAVRHSGATHIAVALTASGGRVGFTIEDDGTGFDPDAVARGGRGLTTMRQRANALGGTLAWAPRKGGGTVVSFSADLG